MEDKKVNDVEEENKKESNIVFVPPELNKISSNPINVSLSIFDEYHRMKIWKILTLIEGKK